MFDRTYDPWRTELWNGRADKVTESPPAPDLHPRIGAIGTVIGQDLLKLACFTTEVLDIAEWV
jgi:hypothetical protein